MKNSVVVVVVISVSSEELSVGYLTGSSSTVGNAGFGVSRVVPLSEEEARVRERREKRLVERRESEILGVGLGF
ncbi:hypothetical protein N665_0012s0155 [Sinapis alba]|nr:hypothetical protein N665_0012s0155 [Sinapis alba]